MIQLLLSTIKWIQTTGSRTDVVFCWRLFTTDKCLFFIIFLTLSINLVLVFFYSSLHRLLFRRTGSSHKVSKIRGTWNWLCGLCLEWQIITRQDLFQFLYLFSAKCHSLLYSLTSGSLLLIIDPSGQKLPASLTFSQLLVKVSGLSCCHGPVRVHIDLTSHFTSFIFFNFSLWGFFHL